MERESLPQAAEATPSPPAEARATDVFAWMMVAMPLVGALVDVSYRKAYGEPPSTVVALLISSLVYTLLAITDANQIEQSGRNVRRIHLWAWTVLFIPVYIIQRCRAVGQSFSIFFAWLAALATAGAISIGSSAPIYWWTGLPGCDSSVSIAQAKAIFDTLRFTMPLGIHALDVQNAVQISATNLAVTCRASIFATDGKTYHVTFTNPWQGDKMLTRLNVDRIENPPPNPLNPT